MRTMPQAPDMERALLGALLLDNTSFAQVGDLLDEASFYRPAHGLIFAAMRELDKHHEPIDVVTVSEQLRQANTLEEIGGSQALLDLMDALPSAANIEHYARGVHEKAILRKVISLTSETQSLAFESAARADELLETVQSRLVGLVGERRGRHASDIRKAMHQTLEYITALKSSGGQLRGIGSGFTEIDLATGGFASGELIIIAARPSMGKTSLALNIARNAAAIHGKTVLVFSLEMEVKQLALRLMAGEAHISLQRLRGTYHLSDEQYLRLSEAAGRLSELPLFIDDSASTGIDLLRARARQMWIKNQIDLIVVDYLQLITPPKMADNQQQWIAYVSASLKLLAKELGIPIICLSQLSRAPETRGGDRKPMLSDLRDSGAIEQDADVVMFVYRPYVYKDHFKPEKDKDGNEVYEIEGVKYPFTENIAEIIIAKNRNGPVGSLPLTWIGEYTTFATLTREHPSIFTLKDEPPDVDQEVLEETGESELQF